MIPGLSRLRQFRQLHPLRWRVALTIFVPLASVVALLGGTTLANAGRIYHGVSVNGVKVGGLTPDEARAKVRQAEQAYSKKAIPVTYASSGSRMTTTRIAPTDIGVTYDTAAVDQAFEYGRSGAVKEQLVLRLRLLAGQRINVQNLSFDDVKLAGYVAAISNEASEPVANAGLEFRDGAITVTPAELGQRLDIGLFVAALQSRLGMMSDTELKAPVYSMPASIDEQRLAPAKTAADQIAGSPLLIRIDSKSLTADTATLTSWLQVGGRPQLPYSYESLRGFYPAVDRGEATVALDQAKVGSYVAELAKSVNQPAKDAQLGVQDGKVVAVAPSQNGVALNEPEAVKAIVRAIKNGNGARRVQLQAQIARAEVREDNLEQLGLREVISVGESFFPGSPSTRLINVRAGSAKMNNVLIKPNENFNFNEVLGYIGPETGYVPELVILDKKKEKQYGGGLCQVSSTVYRAALLAGLPITQRINHSYAISYYTAPYPVPGVDATIYPPSGVNMRFRNDTGSYILMQSVVEGTTMKVTFYGTKTKSGEIRGPQFITGTSDHTQPSHTVFYRDVKDMSGKVIRTDTVETYYKSSKEFPTAVTD